jgi:hypothetical protein
VSSFLPEDEGRCISALMMEAASTSETSINFYQTTRRNIPEDSHLQTSQPFEVRLASKQYLKIQYPTSEKIQHVSITKEQLIDAAQENSLCLF